VGERQNKALAFSPGKAQETGKNAVNRKDLWLQVFLRYEVALGLLSCFNSKLILQISQAKGLRDQGVGYLEPFVFIEG